MNLGGRTALRWPTIALVLLVSGVAAAQDKSAAYSSEMQRGNSALDQGRPEDALQAFKRARGLRDSEAADACLGMALAYQRLRAFKNAVESCDDALKRNRNDRQMEAQIRNVRGVALSELASGPGDKKLKEAEAEFRAALTANNLATVALFNLGTTLLRQSRDDEGIQALKAYLDRDPSGRRAPEAQRLIENPKRARVSYAPDFAVTTRQGDRIALSDLKGKIVLIDFWGSWCKPCVAAVPGLTRLAKKYASDQMIFISIAEDKKEDWDRFIEQNKMTWPQYLDETRQLAELFGVREFPTYIILDGEGIIQARRSGYGNGTDGWIGDQIQKAQKAMQNR
jgi:thiol-disulfide isomerase/thioredoxin/predicted negative regulator of RcsB-dependent stress response